MHIQVNNFGGEPITVTPGTTIEVSLHSRDWFPLYIRSGLHHTTVYLRRDQLHALFRQINECLRDSYLAEAKDPGEQSHDDWSARRGGQL
jgi:hypothetical protein